MIEAQIDGNVYQIKTRWDEMSVAEFRTFQNLPDYDEARVLSFLTGIKFEKLAKMDCRQVSEKLFDLVEFLREEPDPFESDELPPVVSLYGKEYTTALDIEKSTWEATRVAKKIMREQMKEKDGQLILPRSCFIDIAPKVCAVFYCQEVDDEGVYRSKLAEELRKEFEALPFYLVFRLAAFFLNNWTAFSDWKRAWEPNRSRSTRRRKLKS